MTAGRRQQHQNEKVGSLDLSDEVFGGRVKTDLIWESVVHANAAERRGTHATKTRALVSGTRQEAVAAEGHRPGARRRGAQPAVAQGRHGVRAAAAQLRLPRCRRRSRRGALRAALAQKLRDGAGDRRRRAGVDDDQDEGGRRDAAGGSASTRQGAARRREAGREAGAGGAQHRRACGCCRADR